MEQGGGLEWEKEIRSEYKKDGFYIRMHSRRVLCY